jgi:hypothetical protein
MIKIFIFFFTSILTTTIGHASAPFILEKISKGYSGNTIQFTCTFNSSPQYSVNTSEKRINITFEKTNSADNLTLPETDDKIVKILSLPKDNAITISLFFRYPPQKVKAATGQEANQIILTVRPGNEFSAILPSLATQQPDNDTANPLTVSPYRGNWKDFIKRYEAQIPPLATAQFSLPPFPVITLLPPEREENTALLSPEIIEGSRQNLWNDLIPLILDKLNREQNPEIKKKLTLTYGEILLRAGNYKEAYKQFYLLSTQHLTEPAGILAKYLLLRLQAEYADLYLAATELNNLEGEMNANNPIAPWFILTQLEIALATENLDRAKILLEKDDIAYPAIMAPLKALRQAEYWLATGEFIKAHAGFQLLEKSGFLAKNNSSLGGYCSLLYRHEQFKQALDCYDRLAKQSLTSTQQQPGMISYHKAMSKLHLAADDKAQAAMLNNFIQIELTYPDTEAGTRAALKQIDLKLLSMKKWEKPALGHYQTLAETAQSRSIREEASIKMAIVHLMLEQKDKSVELLRNFLRDYKNGELHDTALALLIDILPDLLKEQVKNGKYIEALVLAQQNKSLFMKGWLNTSLLTDMAEAYRQLGFFNEASKTYLYIMDVSAQEAREPYYLPLIRLAYEQGESETVEDYASQYATHFPQGKDNEEILYLRTQNLMAHNQYKEALALVTDGAPKTPGFKLLQASLLFYLGEYAKARALLEEIQITASSKETDPLFMLAESAYQLGDSKKAEELFLPLQEDSAHRDQVLFRLAEIARYNKQKELSLKLFKQIVETGKNPLWQRMAKKELELIAFNK